MSLASVHMGDLVKHSKSGFVGEVAAKRYTRTGPVPSDALPDEVQVVSTVAAKGVALGESRWLPTADLEAAK